MKASLWIRNQQLSLPKSRVSNCLGYLHLLLQPVAVFCCEPNTQAYDAYADYSAASAASVSNTTGTGVFILLLINLTIFVLDHSFHLPQIRMLYLDHIGPKWWQFITSSFCHASWQHLSSNTFLLYVFGKIVEEEEGMWGVWWTYLITAAGVAFSACKHAARLCWCAHIQPR